MAGTILLPLFSIYVTLNYVFCRVEINLRDKGLMSFPRSQIPFNAYRIDVSENEINETRPSDFAGYTSCRQILINGNNLTAFPDFGEMAPKLQWVLLRDNKIAYVSYDAINKLENMNKLEIYTNRLTSLPDAPAPGKYLTNLHMSYNFLSDCPTLNNIGRNVKRLSMSFNGMKTLNITRINNLIKLQRLTATNNLIEIFPNLSFCANTLEILRLQENKITYVQLELIGFFKKIGTVNLEGNNLLEFVDIRGLTTLGSITLFDNRITTFHKDSLVLGKLERLLKIDLQNNQIHSVSPLQVDGQVSLDLRGCPLLCDHKMAWAVNHPNLTQPNWFVCKEPEIFRGKTVSEIASLSYRMYEVYFTIIKSIVIDNNIIFCEHFFWLNFPQVEIYCSMNKFSSSIILASYISKIKFAVKISNLKILV